VAASSQKNTKRIDRSRFADAGRSGDADADRLASEREQVLNQLVRSPLVIGALALDQCDGARKNAPLAVADSTGDRLEVRARRNAIGARFHGGVKRGSTRIDVYLTMP
jgi:hypothetical protein